MIYKNSKIEHVKPPRLTKLCHKGRWRGKMVKSFIRAEEYC